MGSGVDKCIIQTNIPGQKISLLSPTEENISDLLASAMSLSVGLVNGKTSMAQGQSLRSQEDTGEARTWVYATPRPNRFTPGKEKRFSLYSSLKIYRNCQKYKYLTSHLCLFQPGAIFIVSL